MSQPSSQTFALTAGQRAEFLETGVVRVPGAIPSASIEAMADRIWGVFTRQLGFLRDRPDTWTAEPGATGAIHKRLLQMSHAGVFDGMLGPNVRGLLDDFFGGRGWRPPRLPPRPLGLVFPTATGWNVPTRHWHLDRFEADQSRSIGVADRPWPGYVRAFAYLDVVEAGGGGTVYVAGSHRAATLVVADARRGSERVPSAKIVQRLKGESAWIADLCSKGEEDAGRINRFMHADAEFRGVPLRVAEMTGRPGEVILWHPNLLHTAPSGNARDRPRLVLSVTIEANEEADGGGVS